MENLGVLISGSLFLSLASLGEVRQGISHSISLFLMIIDLEVILREFLGPVDLTRAQAFCIHELIEIIMVSKDKDFIFVAFLAHEFRTESQRRSSFEKKRLLGAIG